MTIAELSGGTFLVAAVAVLYLVAMLAGEHRRMRSRR